MSALPWVIIAGIVGALALTRKSSATASADTPPAGVMTPTDWQAFFYPPGIETAPDEATVSAMLKNPQLGPIRSLLYLVPGHTVSISRYNDPLVQKLEGDRVVVGPFDAQLVWLSPDKSYGAVNLPSTVTSLLPGTPDPQNPGKFVSPPIAQTILAYIAPPNL